MYGRPLNIFFQGASRAVRHSLPCQWENGCFPYRAGGDLTINYTALVCWCLRNVLDCLPAEHAALLAPRAAVQRAFDRATAFLRSCVAADGSLRWDGHESSTAKYNLWAYVLTFNVLMRAGTKRDLEKATRLWRVLAAKRTDSGLLPMRDRGETITECAYMQADMLLFLLPFAELAGGRA